MVFQKASSDEDIPPSLPIVDSLAVRASTNTVHGMLSDDNELSPKKY